jgi:Methyltransferase domain
MTENMYLDGTYLANTGGTWNTDDCPFKARYVAEILRRNGLQPQTVCEVGCGAGEILNQLLTVHGANFPADARFEGYDIAPVAIEMAKRRETDRLQFFCRDLFETQAHHDLMLTIDVIEHVEDYFSFLRRLRDRASHHVFHIPLEMSSQMVAQGSPLMWARKAVGHIHHFNKDMAVAVLEDTGYEVVDYLYTPGYAELPMNSLKRAVARLPRKVLFPLKPDLTVRLFGGYSLMALARPKA